MQQWTAPRLRDVRSVRLGAFIAPVALAALAFVSACSSSSAPPTTSSTTTTAPSTESGSGAAVPPVYEVSTGTVKGLGTVLVDGQGFTLYLFVPDHQSESTCYGQCAEAWPPLLLPTGVSTPVAGPGVNSKLLGTTHRTDGTVELTYNGWPLYTWTGDSTPGQATGQGLNSLGGLWYVLSPSGKEITTKAK